MAERHRDWQVERPGKGILEWERMGAGLGIMHQALWSLCALSSASTSFGTSFASSHPKKHRLFAPSVGTGLLPASSPPKKDHLHHLPLGYLGKKGLGKGTRALVELFFHRNKRESGGRKPASPVPREWAFCS